MEGVNSKMDRLEFMKQLESLLGDIPATEREEALQYYNDYFDDAGCDNEQEVLEALGSPERVAGNIKSDLNMNNGNVQAHANDRALILYGEETLDGASDNVSASGAEMLSCDTSDSAKDTTSGSGLSNGMIVLIVVLCVLASPVLIGIASGLIGGIVGIVAAWFSLMLGFGVTAVALLIVFMVLAVVAVIGFFTEPMAGVALLGGSMICGGLGILLLMLTVAMVGIATPAIGGAIVTLVKKIFRKA